MFRQLCLLASLCIGTCSSALAATVSLVPSTSAVEVGATVALELRVSDVGSNGLGTFDLDVLFDPALVTLSGVTYGSGLDVLGLGSLQFATASADAVNLFELSLDSAAELLALQLDSFVLATLNFVGVTPGSAVFALSLNALGDAYGDSLSASLVDAAVTILAPSPSTVSEPAPYALLSAALAALALSRRRRVSAGGAR